MSHEIVLAPQAVQDLRRLRANVRAQEVDAIERHLRHEPMRTSKSRIKKLRGLTKPQYPLRIGDVRVFYDVSERSIEVLAIVSKSNANTWLEQEGEAP